MGARGPKPGTGGRPCKPLAEKLLDGNPGKRNIRVLKNYTDLEGADMPDPKDYLQDAQKDGRKFEAEEIYRSVWRWLHERQCAQHVSAELIEHYALSAARLIQCERAVSTYGFLAKNSQGNARYVALYRYRAGVYEAGEQPVEHDLQHRQRKLLHRLFRRYAAGRYYGTSVERKAEKLKYSILKAHIGRKGKVCYVQSDEFRF